MSHCGNDLEGFLVHSLTRFCHDAPQRFVYWCRNPAQKVNSFGINMPLFLNDIIIFCGDRMEAISICPCTGVKFIALINSLLVTFKNLLLSANIMLLASFKMSSW